MTEAALVFAILLLIGSAFLAIPKKGTEKKPAKKFKPEAKPAPKPATSFVPPHSAFVGDAFKVEDTGFSRADHVHSFYTSEPKSPVKVSRSRSWTDILDASMSRMEKNMDRQMNSLDKMFERLDKSFDDIDSDLKEIKFKRKSTWKSGGGTGSTGGR